MIKKYLIKIIKEYGYIQLNDELNNKNIFQLIGLISDLEDYYL